MSEDKKLLIGAPILPGLQYADDNQEVFASCGHKVSLSLEAMAYQQKEDDVEVVCFFCAKERVGDEESEPMELPGSREALVAEFGEEEGNRLFAQAQDFMKDLLGRKKQ